jgi:hypothetical protein
LGNPLLVIGANEHDPSAVQFQLAHFAFTEVVLQIG